MAKVKLNHSTNKKSHEVQQQGLHKKAVELYFHCGPFKKNMYMGLFIFRKEICFEKSEKVFITAIILVGTKIKLTIINNNNAGFVETNLLEIP